MDKPWTEDDIDYLAQFSVSPEGDLIRDTADFLGRSEVSARNKLSRIRKNGQGEYLSKPWTSREIKILKSSYFIISNKELAYRLGRSADAVKIKASKLGISKKTNVAKWGRTIRHLAMEGCTRKEISKQIGIPYDSICGYIWLHKIECRNSPKELQQKRWREQEAVRYAYVRGEIK
ncbi:hypothetical protein NIE88_21585 [Sporolactobacillus shoreicorticis]|uniref:GcrA cell cycle regulator n=1 Tax=Sporolactobacillus shoreicorticis TaxID=1923877 RepID=A0ABW5RYS4_9BACL|nr:hypothetical protein [Sporolactobacillus shoreicorticis]MCO7128322.1 hypothetical protein [Sporolactobacillus shoreicorticis]